MGTGPVAPPAPALPPVAELPPVFDPPLAEVAPPAPVEPPPAPPLCWELPPDPPEAELPPEPGHCPLLVLELQAQMKRVLARIALPSPVLFTLVPPVDALVLWRCFESWRHTLPCLREYRNRTNEPAFPAYH